METGESVTRDELDKIDNMPTPSILPDQMYYARKENEEDYIRIRKLHEDHRRQRILKNAVNYSIAGAIYLFSLTFVIVVILRGIHLILAPGCGWMTVEQIDTIDKFISYVFVGSLGTFLAKYMSKNVNE